MKNLSKKSISAFFLLLSLTIISGCGGSGGGGDEKSGYYLPKTITTKDSAGNVLSTIQYNRNRYGNLYWEIDDGIKKYEHKIKYNDKNLPKEKRIYLDDTLVNYEKYLYVGNYITNILSNNSDSDRLESDNGIGSSIKYKYLNNYVILIEKDRDNDGIIDSNITIEYYRNNYGKVKTITDSLGLIKEYKYNASGNIIEIKSHGTILGNFIYSYSYNDKGSLIKEEIESSRGKDIIEYHLTYDNNDNIIKRDIYKNGTFSKSEIITWNRYDIAPSHLKGEYFLPEDGNMDPLRELLK